MEKKNLNSKNKGFKTPEGYFDNFEDRLLDRLSLNDEKSSEPDFGKKPGFALPDGYMDSFEDRLFEALPTEVKETKVISLFSRKSLMYAASIAIIIFSSVFMFKSGVSEEEMLEGIELASLETYIDDGNLNLDTYEIAALIGDDINDLDLPSNENIDEDELLEYLSNEEIPEDLFENL